MKNIEENKIFIIYLIKICILISIFIFFFKNKFPYYFNEFGDFEIKNLDFFFGEIYENIKVNNQYKINYMGIDFYVGRMPLVPYLLLFFDKFFFSNIYFIFFFKNIFLLIILFFILKNIFKNSFF